MEKNLLKLIVVFQIFILVLMSISVSYNIHQFDLIDIVSADEEVNGFSCCPETIDGAICQEVPSNFEECAVGLVPTRCNSYSDCQIGCCFDGEEGLCSTNSPKLKCETDGGTWDNNKDCNILECQKGCCILGEETQFVTEQRCEQLSLIFGFEESFRGDLRAEYQCIALSANQSTGACIFEDGSCKFGTESQCLMLDGRFSEGDLCSKEELGTTCEKQTSIGCVEGKDEIYWFDSCGNRENIYSSDKEVSWNNGKVLSKAESCNVEESNIDSTDCGNCNYFLGSVCSDSALFETSVKDGDFLCKNLNCIDENGTERKNGESWCVYDGYIGGGKDPVGSRHWKRICIDGEILVEPCSDYRGQVCVESQIPTNKTESGNFSIAACVVNEASKCLNYGIGECSKNEFCVVKKIDIDDDFDFDVCSAKYPKGFDLSGESHLESQDICSVADQTCMVMYEKNWGSWDCVMNCDCEDSEFGEKLNDLCVSLGDCGSYINYIGDGTDNSNVKNSPDVSWRDYIKYSEPVEGQFAKPQNISVVLDAMGIGGRESTGEVGEEPEPSDLQKAADLMGTITNYGSYAISAVTYGTGVVSGLSAGTGLSSFGYTTATNAGASILGPAVGALSSALSGISIGMMVGSYAAQLFGIQGDAATALSIAGGIAGGVAGLAFGGYLGGTAAGIASFGGAISASTPVLGLGTLGAFAPILACFVWAVIVVVILVIIFKIFGFGDTKIIEVEFKCRPWEAPVGGDNCEACNGDPLKPCSEYRCQSLGQACKLVNEDSDKPTCAAVPDDQKPPIISTGEILKGFEFSETEDYKTKIIEVGKECITEFTPVAFSLKTDEYAQCKYSLEKTEDYDSMEEYTAEQNLYSINHSFIFSMPSVDSLPTSNLIGDLTGMYSDMNFYVRCQDYHGNYNLKEYIINFCVNNGPDITPPSFVAGIPRNDSSLEYGAHEVNLSVFLNEPVDCRIDTKDVDYTQMSTEMFCNNDVTEFTKLGWGCWTNLTGLDKKENNFYIRCKDQPWLAEDVVTEKNKITGVLETKTRNANSESLVYTFKTSPSKLKIDSIEPNGKIYSGFEPMTVDLVVKTSGGADDGNAMCYYKFTENSEPILFYETYHSIHEQELNTMMDGIYNVEISCEDNAGNVAEGEASFEVFVDSYPPEVVRTYIENGKLIVITDEDAECYYSFEECYFNKEEATQMSATFTKEHVVDFTPDKVYHIRCEDIWKNKVEGCSIKIREW